MCTQQGNMYCFREQGTSLAFISECHANYDETSVDENQLYSSYSL